MLDENRADGSERGIAGPLIGTHERYPMFRVMAPAVPAALM
jgi:hypothetical protein